MAYVREQTSAELAAHMRSLQAMPGWFEPLADRLWEEVQSLQSELATAKRDMMLVLAAVVLSQGGKIMVDKASMIQSIGATVSRFDHHDGTFELHAALAQKEAQC